MNGAKVVRANTMRFPIHRNTSNNFVEEAMVELIHKNQMTKKLCKETIVMEANDNTETRKYTKR